MRAIKIRLRGRFFGAFRRFKHCLKAKDGAQGRNRTADTGIFNYTITECHWRRLAMFKGVYKS